MQIAALWWTLILSGSDSPVQPPAGTLIAHALELIQHCDGPAVVDLLSETDLQRLRMQALAARSAELDHPIFAGTGPYLLKQWRTQAAPLTEQQLYKDECLAYPSDLKAVAGALRPGPAWMHENRAWVPLLSADDDYFGLGLAMVLEQGQWRLSLHTHTIAHVQIRHPAHAALWQRIDAQVDVPYRCEDEKLPPPPEPQELDVVQLEAGLWEEDQANVWGYLQRQATRHYAGAPSATPTAVPPVARPSPSAQALWAQAVYSSLGFDDAPDHTSAQWERRLRNAVGYAQRAIDGGVDARELALPIVELAKWQLSRDLDSPANRQAALDILAPALAARASQALLMQALLLSDPVDGSKPQCTVAAEALVEAAASEALVEAAAGIDGESSEDGAEALIDLAVTIELDCPDPAARRPEVALRLLGPDVEDEDARTGQYIQCLLKQDEQQSCELPDYRTLAEAWSSHAEHQPWLSNVSLRPGRNYEETPDCD